jgi:hypothetical protein
MKKHAAELRGIKYNLLRPRAAKALVAVAQLQYKLNIIIIQITQNVRNL